MPSIEIKIKDRIAEAQGDPVIICGNSDYAVTFDFDAEWDNYPLRTVRFEYYKNGLFLHQDVAFTGNAVMAPPFYDTGEALIGVYAGNIQTTTPARIPCSPCIVDNAPAHEDPPLDVYDQLLQLLATVGGGGATPVFSNPIADGTDLSVTGVATYEEAN